MPLNSSYWARLAAVERKLEVYARAIAELRRQLHAAQQSLRDQRAK